MSQAIGGTGAGPLRERLPGSVTSRVRRVEGAPVVAIRLWLPGGARSERRPGENLVTGQMLTEGSRSRDWRRIALDAEDRGMSITGFGGFEGHGLAVEALAGDWERALNWASELVQEPTFPLDRFDWTVQQTAAELEGLTDQPAVVTGWKFLDQLYRPHPRSRPLHGSRTSLEMLRREECERHHRESLGSGPLVTVAGLIDAQQVEARIADLFGQMVIAPVEAAQPPAPQGMKESHLTVDSGGADQAHLYCGHLTVDRRHPDHAALNLLGVVLGSGPGLTGRIPERIREQEGLAYTAYADTVVGSGLDPGRLVIYLATSPSSVVKAEVAVREEVERLLDSGVTEDEAQGARSYLLGREPFRRETARQWADILLEAEITGLPVDRPDWLIETLAGLDRSEIERVAREHLNIGRLKVTVGLPAGKEEGDGPRAGRG